MTLMITFISLLANVLNVLILIRVLLSWVPAARSNRLGMLVYEITEPIVGPIRRLVPSLAGLDFSPFIAMLVIGMAEQVLVSVFSRFA